MSYLQHIDNHKERIITGIQVEMEYKKNRQKVILDSLGKFKNPDWNNLSVPALLAESEEAAQIEAFKKSISEQQSKINNKIESLLRNPHINDPVFNALDQLFSNKSDYNLDRNNPARNEVREKAITRFMLGYPPRKENDTSIGDAINWEWILRCAKESKKNVIIVTRDGDYGASRKDESFINDWLYQEFKDRVGNDYNIVLTQRLSSALKLINVSVTEEMEKEEDIMLKQYTDLDIESEDNSVTKKIFDILNKHNY